ncbi:MAG: type II toxin-antitoxin system PemK/MazF family toxin, partial [Acidimicrobiia bacterium]
GSDFHHGNLASAYPEQGKTGTNKKHIAFPPPIGQGSRPNVEVKDKQHKAMADQIATASKRRLQEKMGRISDSDFAAASHKCLNRLHWTGNE